MSNIRQFLRYHKEYILDETKNRLHSTIRKEKNLTSDSFQVLLQDVERHLDAVLNNKIKSLPKKELKIALGRDSEVFENRKDMIEELIKADDKKTFKNECMNDLQTYIASLQTKSQEVILKENAQRRTIEEKQQIIQSNKNCILERIEQGDQRIEDELRKYIAFEVADLFLHDKTHFLFHELQTVGDLIPIYYYTLKIKPACEKKWILTGMTIIREEKGNDIFKGTFPKRSTAFKMLMEYVEDGDIPIKKKIDRFYETISEEDFKTLFFEGINNNPKLEESWKKQRVRRLVGHNKK